MVGFWPIDSQYGGADLSGNKNHMILHEILQHSEEVEFLNDPDSFGEIKTSPSLRLHKKLSWFGSVTIVNLQDGPLFSWSTETSWGVHIWVHDLQFYAVVDYEGSCQDRNLYLDELSAGQTFNLGVSVDVVNAVLTMWVNGKSKTTQLTTCSENLDTTGSVYVGTW